MRSERFILSPNGPFSLAASTRFLEGFAPAALGQQAEGRLNLAFCLEGSWEPVGVEIWQDGDLVVGRYTGQAPAKTVAENVARILSLDVDGSGFDAVGARDPVVGRLQARYPGLRPVGFWSAYEAAAWTVISQRVRMVQAAKLKSRIADELGHSLEAAGRWVSAFPSPAQLASLESIPSLPQMKFERLRGIAQAAADGLLDSRRLRSMDAAEALSQLERLPGIGPFSAELILIRGAMAPDVFPTVERRLHDSMRSAYGLPGASVDDLDRIAGAWRPFRSWVSLLFRTAREADLHEIEPIPTA